MIKTTFLLPVCATLMAVAVPALAQVGNPPSRTVVTFSDGVTCTTSPVGPPAFLALSVATKGTVPTNSSLTGSVRSTGRLTFDDVVLTRNVDDCSVPLYALFFGTNHVKTVTISFQNFVNGSYKEALLITLADALITSLADTEASNLPASERISLGFGRITIFDPVTGKTASFDASRGF